MTLRLSVGCALRQRLVSRPVLIPSSYSQSSKYLQQSNNGHYYRFHTRVVTPVAHQSPVLGTKQRVLQTVPLTILLRNLLVLSVAALPRGMLSIIIGATKKYGKLLSSSNILSWPIRSIFYKTFCIGVDKDDIAKNLKGLRALGINGVILAFARETKFDYGSSCETLTPEDPQMREWVDLNLQTIDNLGKGDYLALRLTGAGDAAVRTLARFSSSNESREELAIFMDAVNEVCEAARANNVRVLVDAESSKHQRAIDEVTLTAMAKFNTQNEAFIYNTYQMYLKSNISKMKQHIAAARDKHVTIGIKLVRGAYMHSDSETDSSVFHDSKLETDAAYDEAVGFLLGTDTDGKEGDMKNTKSWNAEVMLATHNSTSVNKAFSLWQSGKASPQVPNVNGGTVQRLMFAQLMGMADEISMKLAMDIRQAKNENMDRMNRLPDIGVYKYTIWGTFGDCLLYMIRRAEENQDALARTRGSAAEVAKEIGRRCMPIGI